MNPARKALERGVASFVVAALVLLPTPAARGAEVVCDQLTDVFPIDLTPDQIRLDIGRA